jgi:CspA family cold shock protein
MKTMIETNKNSLNSFDRIKAMDANNSLERYENMNERRIIGIITALLLTALFVFLALAPRAEAACQDIPAPAGPTTVSGQNMVPLFRYNVAGDHFYTANWNSLKGCNYESVTGYIFPTQQPRTLALHRFYSHSLGNHFYTTRSAEVASLNSQPGYKYEGITGYVYSSAQAGTAPLSRFYNTRPDYLYTANAAETNALRQSSAWQDDGVMGHVVVSVIPNTHLGVVKFINAAKGYGFIIPNAGGNDVFFHGSNVQGGLSSLSAGRNVLYEIY